MKAGSRVQSYLCEKNKETHSFSLSLTNIYGMSGIMKKQFQCYEAQRLGMKKLLVTHCTTWNDNLLLETRAVFSILFRGHHRTGWTDWILCHSEYSGHTVRAHQCQYHLQSPYNSPVEQQATFIGYHPNRLLSKTAEADNSSRVQD